MLRTEADPQKKVGDVVTMWIPTPSMTVPQRMVLYGTCVVALVNSVGLLVLMAQQNQQRSWLEQTGARLTEVEQSSVVEFLQEVPAGMRARPEQHQHQYQYQYSRNKRSDALEKETSLEHQLLEEEEEVKEEQGVSEQETSQEVGEETERKRHEVKHKHRHSQQQQQQRQHKAHVQDDMMMMMTYSMVPVREKQTGVDAAFVQLWFLLNAHKEEAGGPGIRLW